MPLKMTEKNIKDRLKEDTLDLSLCELKEVPVPKIAAVKKARNLDLSNNLLVTLPPNFIMLTNIVKLDLSKNMLIEIPENIGELKQLKHLDLYENQISRLPLSLSELKNLRWLDLKENPLTPAVASIAGPCSNSQECQACARNVVSYLEHVKLTIEEERLRRSNALATGQSDISTQVSTKKENKQKKKRSAESDKKKNMQNSEKSFKTDLSSNEKHTNESKTPLNGEPSHHSYTDGFCSMLGRCLAWIFLYLFIFGLSIVLILFLLSLYDSRKVNSMVEYLSDETGLFLKTYQVWNKDIWNNFSEIIKIWVDRLTHKINEYL